MLLRIFILMLLVYFLRMFINEFKKAVDTAKMKMHVLESVAKSSESTKWGLIFFGVPVFVNLFLATVTFPSGFSAIFSRFLIWPLMIPVLSISISVFAVGYIAKRFFEAKGEIIWLFRLVSYVSIVLWLTMVFFFIGVLGIFDSFGPYSLIWIVNLVLIFNASEKAFVSLFGLNKKDSLILAVLIVVGFFVFKAILGNILVGGSYRMVY